jgi:hypothetical protein
MTWFVTVVLALALLSAVFALGREIRLRRALEKLLHILLSRWRNHAEQRSNAIDPDPIDLDERL